MIEKFVCDCLNVTVQGNSEDVTENEVNFVHQLVDSISGEARNEIKRFLDNSKLIKLKIFEPVEIRHSFLCLKRNVGNFQINFCANCEKETHAILINSEKANFNKSFAHDSLVLICLNEADKVEILKSSPEYSSTFDIVLPRKLKLKSTDKIIGNNPDINFEDKILVYLSDAEMHASEKVNKFLQNEKDEMESRIKRFHLEEMKRFEELRQNVLEEKKIFLDLVQTIRQSHDLLNDSNSFDKENDNDSALGTIVTDDSGFSIDESKMMEINSDYFRQDIIKDSSYSKQKNRPADFDGLFDIDDIDVEGNMKTVPEAVYFDDEEDEEQDTFPLKENSLISNDISHFSKSFATDVSDEPFSRTGLSIKSSENNLRTRKMASSVVQNIPYSFQGKNRNSQQTPNSLPIKIPHFRSRMAEQDNDESYNFKPSESIAERILKISKGERKEIEIDDRPRRRLNTGDIVKSRRILN